MYLYVDAPSLAFLCVFPIQCVFEVKISCESVADMCVCSIESFKQLSALVIELATSLSDTPPQALSHDIVARVPPHLRSMFEDSDSDSQLRRAYVAHLITSILVERVFTPFLFGLGRRSEETATLLTDVSDQLRAKSARREATWRQHTLLAAYTTTDAKARMNKEAGKVMDEIVCRIAPFSADESRLDELRAAVRKIVKLAVETWRYARLERERIEAFMPAVESLECGEQDEGLWLPFSGDNDAHLDADHEKQSMLLRIFPVIRREPIQGSFLADENDRSDSGCVYSKGLALYGG